MCETIDSILFQLESSVELVIVDNGSTDNTSEVIAQYLLRHPGIRYFRKQENNGSDRNFDDAVKFARGDFCWLMSDDDLICPGAIANVLSVLGEGNEDDLIVVNSEVRNVDLSELIEDRLMKLYCDKVFREGDQENLFTGFAKYLSFIGCFVIRRDYWLSKNSVAFYGTWFIHVGVIFESPPIVNVRVMSEPSVIIRLGNAGWNSSRFEIWMISWPRLIWSFLEFSDSAKMKVIPQEPWRHLDMLLKNRAMGAYTEMEYRKIYLAGIDRVAATVAYFVSIMPKSAANFLVVFYLSLFGKNKDRALYDLLNTPYAGFFSHLIVKIMKKKSV